jgi:hypothetical protein
MDNEMELVGSAESVGTSGGSPVIGSTPGHQAHAGLLPLERRQRTDLVVGHGPQPLQDILEVRTGVDPVHATVLDQSEDRGVAHACLIRPEE